MLAGEQMGEQNDPPIGKLKRIMVRARVVHANLPESSHPMSDWFSCFP
jgi:hypothetical protein